jgi:hypothetical protein
MRTAIERGYPSKFRASGLVFWVRADSGITIATGVSAWADRSGAGNNLVQATGAAQPAFQASAGPRSRPCVTYDGSNDLMSATFTLNHPATRIVVGIWRAAYVAVDTLFDGAGGFNRGRLSRNGSTNNLQLNPALAAGTATSLSWHVYTILMNGNPTSWRVENAEVASGDSSASTTIGGATQGAPGSGGFAWANVSIAEDLMLSSVPTESIIARMNHYAGSMYGLAA